MNANTDSGTLGLPSAKTTSKDLSFGQITDLIESSSWQDWLNAARQPNMTVRQLMYLVRRLVEANEQDCDEAQTLELLRAIQKHPNYNARIGQRIEMCQRLASSKRAIFWLDLAKSRHSDAESLRSVHQKNQQQYREEYFENAVKNYTHEVQSALAANPNTPDDVLKDLVQVSETFWPAILQRPHCDRRILDYVLRRLENSPDDYADYDQMLASINNNDNAGDSMRMRVAKIRHLGGLAVRVQDPTLSEAELIRIAKACAEIDKYPLQIRRIVNALVWHPQASTTLLYELMAIPQSVVYYLVARSDLADEELLLVLVHKLADLQKRNPLLYINTVVEILRNRNVTADVITELVHCSPDRIVWERVASISKTSTETLQQIADQMVATDFLDWPRNRPTSVMINLMTHQNGSKVMYERWMSREQQLSYDFCWSAKCAWQEIQAGTVSWRGEDSDNLKTRPEIIRFDSWQMLTQGCLAEDDYYGPRITPDTLSKALQYEWLSSGHLDKITRMLVFEDWHLWVKVVHLDSSEETEVVKSGGAEALCKLFQHSLLTELSRILLLKMDNACGAYLRKYASGAAHELEEGEAQNEESLFQT